MREYFVPENSEQKSDKKCVSILYQKILYPWKKRQKMREYFVPENIQQKKAVKNA